MVDGYSGDAALLPDLIKKYVLCELPDGLLMYDGTVSCERRNYGYICRIS